MKLIYNLSLFFYYLAIKLASLFNAKAKLWINGRKHIFSKIELVLHSNTSPLIWFHCASLGEFEQGRPLIEKIKKEYPSHKIALSFFSPSGYEIRKNYSGADYIFYLPIDTPANAKKLVALLNPQLAFFVKYEFWFNYLNELKSSAIPTYLVSGIFREKQHFFKPYGNWFRKQLSCFTHFFLQDKTSELLLNSIGYTNTTIAGDTRFDRVYEISKDVTSYHLLEQFCKNIPTFIIGSSWPDDEQLIAQASKSLNTYKLIIAPHEIDEQHIQFIEEKFSVYGNCIRYTKATDASIINANVLIIDNMGMLSSLYQYGTIAYIGGGLGKGIHNILEAATFGLPIIFGPNYHKFLEAKELISQKGAFTINDVNELASTLHYLSIQSNYESASASSKKYIQSNIGATNKILSSITIK
jgi:3-deoxy-D-manno-octulosonic-acid transferase